MLSRLIDKFYDEYYDASDQYYDDEYDQEYDNDEYDDEYYDDEYVDEYYDDEYNQEYDEEMDGTKKVARSRARPRLTTKETREIVTALRKEVDRVEGRCEPRIEVAAGSSAIANAADPSGFGALAYDSGVSLGLIVEFRRIFSEELDKLIEANGWFFKHLGQILKRGGKSVAAEVIQLYWGKQLSMAKEKILAKFTEMASRTFLVRFMGQQSGQVAARTGTTATGWVPILGQAAAGTVGASMMRKLGYDLLQVFSDTFFDELLFGFYRGLDKKIPEVDLEISCVILLCGPGMGRYRLIARTKTTRRGQQSTEIARRTISIPPSRAGAAKDSAKRFCLDVLKAGYILRAKQFKHIADYLWIWDYHSWHKDLYRSLDKMKN